MTNGLNWNFCCCFVAAIYMLQKYVFGGGGRNASSVSKVCKFRLFNLNYSYYFVCT